MKFRMLEPEEIAQNINLAAIPGKKLRMQFFTFPLVLIPCFYLVILYMIWIAMLLLGEFSFPEVFKLTLLVAVLCIPTVLLFAALLVLNHYFFGRIICVLGKDGIAHKKGFIRWNRVKGIEYEIHLPSRHYYLYNDYCHAIIFTGARQITLDHAPLCLLFFAHKLHPEIPMGLSKDCKRGLLIWGIIVALLPFIIFVLFAFLGKMQ